MINGGTLSLQDLGQQLLTLLTDPTSNLTAAFALYAIITLILLIVLVVAVIFLMSGEDDEELQGEEPVAIAARRRAEPQEASKAPRTPRQVLLSLSTAAAVAVLVWIAAAYTTSNAVVCKACHTDIVAHEIINGTENKHAGTACVSCHEAGGVLGQYTSGTASRAAHFATAMTGANVRHYGRVTSSACIACHRPDISKVTLDVKRGVRMSHAEPLEASATCLDCHALSDGVVGGSVGGMNSCLRCHDSKVASADCSTCHDKKATAAARSRAASFASVQVPEVRCDGCHDQAKECDTCHGTRMPHTLAFIAGAHARAGAVDLYYNGGSGCGKCHTPTRRPCGRCHTTLLGKGHLANNLERHANADEARCNTCHQQWARSASRDFCKDLCHNPDAIAASPR